MQDAKLNLLALAAIQGGNALIPLILFPYILIVIGPDKFSQVVTIEAIAFIVLTASLYSFDISGLRLTIDAAQKSRIEQGNVYYSILWARLLVFSTSSIIALGVCALFFSDKIGIILAWLMFPLGVCLQSSYYYQAHQNNIPLAMFVVIPRLIAVVVAIVSIDADSNALSVSLIVSISYLVSGIVSALYLAGRIAYVSPIALGLDPLAKIREGRPLFIASISVILYRGSNTLLLSFMSAGALAISYYSIAEKYVRMLQAITFPLCQLYSVRAVKKLSEGSLNRPIPILWDNTKYQFLFSIVAIISLALLAWIFRGLNQVALPLDVVLVFFLMVWAIPFGIGNYMFGSIGLSVLRKDGAYAKGVFVTGLIAVAMSLLLIPRFAEYGAAFAYLFAEILLFAIVLTLLKTED